MYLSYLALFYVFEYKVLLTLGWPGICYVDQAGLEPTEIYLFLLPRVLGSKVSATMLSPYF